jgi:inhibitor of nuclear factor kappa-B kinase subunit alpha
MSAKEKRGAVVALHNEGLSPSEISKRLEMDLSTVCKQIKRYKQLGTLEDRPRSGRPVTATTKKNKEIIRNRIRRNSQRSMRKMAKDLLISEGSVRKIVKTQLKLHPYKLSTAHHLTDQMKADRLKKVRKMKRLAAAGRHRSILFTDEKLFTVEQHHNHQNDRQLLPKDAERPPVVTRSNFASSVMVWAGICATGKTPLVFIEKGVKVTAKVYQDQILKDVLDPWARQHFGNQDWTLQQDWAPSHSAKTTIALCKELFPNIWEKDIWPSYSPDLNPMDYSVWSILEKKVCSTRQNSLESLKEGLQRAWDEITEEDLRPIIDNFPKRLEACIKARGGHFESSF